MFWKQSAVGYVDALPGIQRKTLAHGGKTLMVEFVMARASVLPRHLHPYEQTGYLVSGHVRLTLGDEEHDVSPGDAWCIPPDVAHSARMLADSVAVEVFSPVREDYLPDGAG